MARESHYTWQWGLKSSPEALWPPVSDTKRFNRDTHSQGNIKGFEEACRSWRLKI